jgi:acyl-coenzyme A synthetase/AMP-(fatty) acid ligase
VFRRTFGPKRDEEKRGWKKLHEEELHNLYSSPSIIRMIKSRRYDLKVCDDGTLAQI